MQRGRLLSVVDRMIAGDIIKTLLSVLFILTLIIITRRFLRILTKAIEGEISGQAIYTLLGLKTLSTISTLIPPSAFLSVLMVLGRMYRDNEMTILAASGYGVSQIYRSVLILMIPLSVFAAFLSTQVTPWTVEKTQQIFAIEDQSADIRGISAGKFNEYSRGDLVLYVEDISLSGKMHHVFVQNRQHGDLGIIASKSGYVKEDDSGINYIVLKNGYRYEGQPGSAVFSVTEFKEYAVRIDEQGAAITTKREAMPTAILWHSDFPKDIAEFQKRLSIPIGTLILSILAVPIARIVPRGGVYGNFLIAFLIYFSYENLLKVSYAWTLHDLIPTSIGIWWVYVVMLLVSLLLLIRALGGEWIKHLYKQRIAS